MADKSLNHDLQPQIGHPGLVSVARQLTFNGTLDYRNVASIQTISGTGANHLVARFLSEVLRPKTVWFSDPTWENHREIWRHVNPAIERRDYPYYDHSTSSLDDRGMISTLREHAVAGDVVILQACAHNPTGVDPSRELWEAIAVVCEEKGLFPVFDSA